MYEKKRVDFFLGMHTSFLPHPGLCVEVDDFGVL